jgi:hypothetical protein
MVVVGFRPALVFPGGADYTWQECGVNKSREQRYNARTIVIKLYLWEIFVKYADVSCACHMHSD